MVDKVADVAGAIKDVITGGPAYSDKDFMKSWKEKRGDKFDFNFDRAELEKMFDFKRVNFDRADLEKMFDFKMSQIKEGISEKAQDLKEGAKEKLNIKDKDIEEVKEKAGFSKDKEEEGDLEKGEKKEGFISKMVDKVVDIGEAIKDVFVSSDKEKSTAEALPSQEFSTLAANSDKLFTGAPCILEVGRKFSHTYDKEHDALMHEVAYMDDQTMINKHKRDEIENLGL